MNNFVADLSEDKLMIGEQMNSFPQVSDHQIEAQQAQVMAFLRNQQTQDFDLGYSHDDFGSDESPVFNPFGQARHRNVQMKEPEQDS